MNIMLDDDLNYRKTPSDFVRFTTGTDLLDYMKHNPETIIEMITFDNDLGDGLPEGYQVVKRLVMDNWDVTTLINIHSGNPVATRAMKSTLDAAIRRGLINHVTVTTLPIKELSIQLGENNNNGK